MSAGTRIDRGPSAALRGLRTWRAYRLPIPADVLRAGENEVALDVRSGARPLRFAVAYVRLAASRPE